MKTSGFQAPAGWITNSPLARKFRKKINWGKPASCLTIQMLWSNSKTKSMNRLLDAYMPDSFILQGSLSA
jgi:hypothetical protein